MPVGSVSGIEAPVSWMISAVDWSSRAHASRRGSSDWACAIIAAAASGFGVGVMRMGPASTSSPLPEQPASTIVATIAIAPGTPRDRNGDVGPGESMATILRRAPVCTHFSSCSRPAYRPADAVM